MNSSSNSSKSKKSSYIFEKCIIDENEKDFFNTYKDQLYEIFDLLYKKLGKPPENTDLLSNKKVMKKLSLNPIIINEYNLICKYSNKKIKLVCTQNENCYVEINFFTKMKTIIEQEIKNFWICNNRIAILLLKDAKYIYIKNSKKENEIEDDIDNISIFSNIDDFEEAIKNKYVIYATKDDIINIDIIGNNIDDNKNYDVSSDYYDISFLLTGPNSMNFPKIKNPSNVKKQYTKISLDNGFSFYSKENSGYFLYNKKIGMTTELLDYFNNEKASNTKKRNYFYINVNFIKDRSKITKKKYFAYYLSKLFQDSNSYKTFFKKISPLISDNNNNYAKIIYEIIKEFQKYTIDNEQYYFIFDNIYSKVIFEDLKYEYENDYKSYRELSKNKNLFFYYFIQLNKYTADYLDYPEICFRFINNDNSYRPVDYIESFNDQNYKNNYLIHIKNNYNEIMSKYENKDKFMLLLTIKYISSIQNYKSRKEKINIIKEFSDFLHIHCINRNNIKIIDIKNIKFNTKVIRDFFNTQFDSMLCDYINKNEYDIFNEIINNRSVEGILFEKQVILGLIANSFAKEMKIEKIYCCSFKDKNDSFINKEHIIIIQNQCNAPLYDFGIITILDNKITLKIYQLGINKEKKELENLNIDKIKLDIEYFIKQIYLYYGIKISQYTFGIITTKSGYDKFNNNNDEIKKDENKQNDDEEYFMGENYNNKYKNYPIMKEFCKDNNFEFLLFDRNEKKFYSFDNDDKLQVVELMTYIDVKYIIEVMDIYEHVNINKLKKKYMNNINTSAITNNIKSIIKEDISIKVIGKFKYNDNELPNIKNVFQYWEIDENDEKKIWIKYNKRIFSNCNIKELCFKKGVFYGCSIKGIKTTELNNVKNSVIYIPSLIPVKKNKKIKKNPINRKKLKNANIKTYRKIKKFLGIKRKRFIKINKDEKEIKSEVNKDEEE